MTCHRFTLCIVLFLSSLTTLFSQSYVDLVKIRYGTVYNAGFENTTAETNAILFDVATTFPIVVNDKIAIITGVDAVRQEVDLFPNGNAVTLGSITAKIGVSWKHSEQWSGTYILLPKIASEDFRTDGDAFFFGGFGLLKYQKSARMQYRFGIYASSEGFGALVTPVLGLYYQSEDNHWEVTANLPINGDVNYRFNPGVTVGFGFQAPIRSYRLRSTTLTPDFYTQTQNIEVGPYIQNSFLGEKILLRLQVGYASIDYEVYQEGDTLPLRVAAFEFGDDRNRFNPEMTGNFFLRIGAIYRFHLPTKK